MSAASKLGSRSFANVKAPSLVKASSSNSAHKQPGPRKEQPSSRELKREDEEEKEPSIVPCSPQTGRVKGDGEQTTLATALLVSFDREPRLTKEQQQPQKKKQAFVRTNNSTQQRQLALAKFRAKIQRSSPRVGTITPEGFAVLLPAMPPSKKRCAWITCQSSSAVVAYHDEEWGVPLRDDRKLFEMLVLVGVQAELSWTEILINRETYRELFANFDLKAVAGMKVSKLYLLKKHGSIMLQGKICSIIQNAAHVMKIADEFGSFEKYMWSFANNKSINGKYKQPRQVPVKTSKAELISRDMVKRGFRFVSPTIIYSFLQAVGIVNDHLMTCFRHDECIALQLQYPSTD